jgi:hypothetical protein
MKLIEEKPIFIFSICWRTGSTLLQRVVSSTSEAFIWGEPTTLLPLLNSFEKLETLSGKSENARKKVLNKGWQNSWAPVITPEKPYIQESLRSMMYELYGRPAADMSSQRWGFKEVRPNAARNAKVLKRAFPNAKIIFHYRDPFEVYNSIINTKFIEMFEDKFKPMRVWNENATQVADLLDSGFDAYLISHNEVTSEKERLKELFNFIELDFKQSIMEVVGTKTGSTGKGNVPKEELRNVETITQNGRKALGLDE